MWFHYKCVNGYTWVGFQHMEGTKGGTWIPEFPPGSTLPLTFVIVETFLGMGLGFNFKP